MQNFVSKIDIEEFRPKKIMAQRNSNGKTAYYVIASGLSSYRGVWVAADVINSPSVISKYQDRVKKLRVALNKISVIDQTKETGFEAGHVPEEILGITDFNDKFLLMKWKGKSIEDSTFVSYEAAKLQCPHLVIDFYEERLSFDF